MNTSPVTSSDETTSPKTGVRRVPWTWANRFGNSPSSAAASGIRPWSRIQPFSAPATETIATSATILSQSPPHIAPAASANGLADSASCPAGMIPITATIATT
jgi:hypothetical protein